MTLNEYIAIYSKGTTADEYGAIAGTRTLITYAYAKVRPLSGAERERAQVREGMANYRFHIHQRSDLTEADVIVWDGVDYDIAFIANNGPKEPFMYIDASRGGVA